MSCVPSAHILFCIDREREGGRGQRERERKVILASLLKCPEQLGLSEAQARARSVIWVSHVGVRDQTTRAITCCLPGHQQQEAGVRSHSQESSLLSRMGRGILSAKPKCPPVPVFPDKDLTSRPHLGVMEPCEHILNSQQPCAELNSVPMEEKKRKHLGLLMVPHQNRNTTQLVRGRRRQTIPHHRSWDGRCCLTEHSQTSYLPGVKGAAPKSPLIFVMKKNI